MGCPKGFKHNQVHPRPNRQRKAAEKVPPRKVEVVEAEMGLDAEALENLVDLTAEIEDLTNFLNDQFFLASVGIRA